MSEEIIMPEGGKNFSQDDVNTIVAERLSRERSKYADYESLKEKAAQYDKIQESSKSELQKANEKAAELQKQLDDLKSANTLRAIRAKVAEETKVPVELLSGSDEASCKKQAEAILKFAKPSGYPGTQKNHNTYKSNDPMGDAYKELAHRMFGKE